MFVIFLVGNDKVFLNIKLRKLKIFVKFPIFFVEVYTLRFHLKGNALLVQKVTLELSIHFKQNRYGSLKYYKSIYF